MTENTGPELSVGVGSFGRLYRKPDFILPEDISSETLRKLIIDGKLMPSITNVISVRNAPFLMTWATKLVAKAAVETEQKWPGQLTAKPEKAINYLKEAANRERDFWGNQGTRIHNACEALTRGEIIDWDGLTDYEQASIRQWQQWIKEYQPKFEYIESTGFGTTSDGLNYAGTSDFIATINGKRYIGDYKCVTDDTLIMLSDGSQVRAADVKVGDMVVSWDKKIGLHVNPISYVGDNGTHDIIRIVSENGQKLESTENHPILISRNNGPQTWVRADEVKPGDTAYIAAGWDIHHQREVNKWNLGKRLSPYEFGVWWTLFNMRQGGFDLESKISLPRISKEGLRIELKDMGCKFNKKGEAVIKNALEKASRQSKKSVEEIIGLLNNGLPSFVFQAPLFSIEAFLTGIEEVFSNRDVDPKYYYVVLKNVEHLTQLQQLYVNFGINVKLKNDEKTGVPYLQVPHSNLNTIYTHGIVPVRLTKVEKLPAAHTVAIEVANTHNHVTNGFVTHNTNRSGLHVDIALQLAANAYATHLSPDNKTLIEMPKIEGALGVHISPKGVEVQKIDAGEETYKTFEALRKVWDFHSFEGKLHDKKGVFIQKIKSPKDL